MMKCLQFALFIVAVIQKVTCFKSTNCPNVEPMEDFQWEPFLGNWHLFITDADFVDPGDNCYNNIHSLVGNKLQLDQSWILANGDFFNQTLTEDISKPGQLYTDNDVILYGLFGQPQSGKARSYSTVTFTDYTNVQARFICAELKHFWYTEAKFFYYISIRNRGFDSISKIAPLINQFEKLGANLNSLVFLKNDLTCKN